MSTIVASPYSHLKIFHHVDLLRKIKNGERVAPIYIRIKPTNVCNEDCQYCHYKNAYLDLDEYCPSDYIPREKMMEIIEDMGNMGVKAMTFSGGGEPLLYPYIEEAMEHVLAEGIDLSIITNGMLLKERKAELLAHAKWVRLSIDSCRAELYSRLRGVPEAWFGSLCENIQNFAKEKNEDCELGVNFVVSRDNYKDIYEMARLMKSLGINHVKYAPVINNETEAYHLPIREQVMEDLDKVKALEDEHFRIIDLYTNDIQRIQQGIMVFDRSYTNCYVKNFVCTIAANAKVYYCHDKAYLKNGSIGDLKERRFKELWFSKETTERFRKFNAKITCKEHCVFDDRNIMLNQFFSMDMNHVNFL